MRTTSEKMAYNSAIDDAIFFCNHYLRWCEHGASKTVSAAKATGAKECAMEIAQLKYPTVDNEVPRVYSSFESEVQADIMAWALENGECYDGSNAQIERFWKERLEG